MNGDAFLAFTCALQVTRSRAGSRRRRYHMDNLPAHKVSGVHDVIQVAGANLIYLPPYSPRLQSDPEMAFSKLKALWRAAAARTIPDLWQAIADAIKQFKPEECRNYLQAGV